MNGLFQECFLHTASLRLEYFEKFLFPAHLFLSHDVIFGHGTVPLPCARSSNTFSLPHVDRPESLTNPPQSSRDVQAARASASVLCRTAHLSVPRRSIMFVSERDVYEVRDHRAIIVAMTRQMQSTTREFLNGGTYVVIFLAHVVYKRYNK